MAYLSSLDRRRFLKHTWQSLAAGIGLGMLPGSIARAAPRMRKYPFSLGVASGDPTPEGIVLWTRLAPEPLEPASLGTSALRVGWRIARDPEMRRVVRRGTAFAPAELAHSVHVELSGLEPGSDYFYQFDASNAESPVGHFRTAPAAKQSLRELRFAFVTCQDWVSGYYTPYRDMLQRDLDLVLHLGDYTYEYGIDQISRQGASVPAGFGEACLDLRTYRLRHALYKSDPDLQAAHAKFPFAAIWDDHEVANDYSGLAPEYAEPNPEFTARRAAAYQAYYEHMPIRRFGLAPERGEVRVYRRLRFGSLAEINLLDDRQYRSDNPCGDGEAQRCPAAVSGDYTLLGAEQEAWLADGFARSGARWNIVAQQLLVAQLEHASIQPGLFWNDAWDGYPRARQRMLESAVATKLRNPVFLAGDWHSTFVNDLKLDFADPKSRTIATEFVTPAITTGGDGTPYGPYYGPMIPYNPHIQYFEGDKRGYFAATLRNDSMKLELRFMTSVEQASGTGYTERTFVVQDGVAGAKPA